MKKLKKILALVLAMAMCVAMTLPTMAVGHGSITINNAVAGHTYTAYKIFGGTYDATSGKLSDLDWGNGITDSGKTALYEKYGLTEAGAQTAQNVADKIGTGDAKAIEFANAIGVNVQNGVIGTLSGSVYTISNLEDGYYMIVDTWTKDQTSVDGKDYSLARYMIQKVGNATVNNKADKPTVEKKIDGATDTDTETTTKTDYNTANIGDKVPYVVTSVVPNYIDYKEYYMDFSDTLSKGLTFNQATEDGTLKGVSVKIGETPLTADDFEVTVGDYDAKNGTSIIIHLKDLVSRSGKYEVGAPIEITYSATVNDSAVIGNDGNPNTVKLEYSNNPLDSGDGTPDNGSDGVKGETPEDKVVTFVTELELKKVDATDDTKTLEGAVFHIKGSRINKVIKTGYEFVEDASGTYYKLKNNKGYTEQVYTDATKDQYESTETKYKKQPFATASDAETVDVEFEAVTGTDGIIRLTGLATGTYTFTEIQAPAGYNLLSAPVTVEITEESPTADYDGSQKAKWSYKVDSGDATIDTDGKIQFNVENNSGATLPETGGIGTTIFYVLGAILAIGAGLLLVTKKRMNADK